METEVNALQSSAFNMKLFDNIRKGRDAMKVTRGDLDMEQVDKIMEDLEDEKEFAKELAGVIEGPDVAVDDGDLDEEIARLQELMAEEDVRAAAPGSSEPSSVAAPAPAPPAMSVFSLPEVPTTAITPSTSDDPSVDEQLRNLSREMGML